MRNQYTLSLTALSISVLTACGEPSSPASGGDVMPASLVISSPTGISAAVGEPVSQPPSVVVRNRAGAPVAGVSVTFRVVYGGGSIAPALVTSNALGIATLSRWTMGRKAGLNQVTATANGVADVTFAANAQPGPPAAMIKVAGDEQVAEPGSVVPVRPTVFVADSFGNPVPGVPVTFTVRSGGGTVSDATVVTDGLGAATLQRWTLGTAELQSITASAPLLAPVIFTADFAELATCTLTPLATNTAFVAQLTSSGCQDGAGRNFRTYSVVTTVTEMHEFTLTSQDFDASLELRDSGGRRIAGSSDTDLARRQTRLQALLPAGSFTLVVSGTAAGGTGNYTVARRPASPNVSGCTTTYVMRGVLTERQRINEDDCVVTPSRSEDRYRLWARAGSTLEIMIEDWSYSDQHFEVINDRGEIAGYSTWNGAYLYTLTFTSAADAYYTILVYGNAREGLEYTLQVK